MEPVHQTKRLAIRALSDALKGLDPRTEIDRKGYTNCFRDNLVPGVRPEDFEADLRQGDGNELDGKFRAAHSSSALAVNSFGPFRRHIGELSLLGAEPFQCLHFERKCPTGLRGNAPNLDVLLEGEKATIGIESKLTEYMDKHQAHFSKAYLQIHDDRRCQPWFTEMRCLVEDPERYSWLNAAQLVKHAFGLAHTYRGEAVTLLYLYWEPRNADEHSVFSEHRKEIQEFTKRLKGSSPSFRSLSYPELWNSWSETGPDWLRKHLVALDSRYLVSI